MSKNFVVYKSSAGSGKTFTLVKEYLKLALANEQQLSFNYKRILALTFTNKAAAEMRIRILNALKTLSDPDSKGKLEEVLCKEMAIDPLVIKERAQKLINQLLHHYSDFAVSTIDSFSHKIIKTFAHDLDLPVNFNLETNSQEFYNRVISQLLGEIGHDKEITFLLKEYTINNIDEDQSWDPEKKIQEFAAVLQKENSIDHVAQLSQLDPDQLNELKEKIQKFLKEYKSTIVSLGKQGIELIESNNLTNDDFTFKSVGPQTIFYKCSRFETDTELVNSRVQDALLKNNWAAKGLSAEKKEIFDKIIPQLNAIAHAIKDHLETNKAKYNLYSLLNKRLYPILLLGKIQQITTELKNEDQLVFIEEFNAKIFEFIKNEPVAFIYERLGERFKHYLIDEFQDTSTLQWQNILPLVENSLANGNFNLLVGDGKQSIYRWRNANVRQFAMLPAIENSESSLQLQLQQEALQRNYLEQNLQFNFRSTATVVEFNNALFDHLSKTYLKEPLLSIYNRQEQTVVNKEQGYITVVNKPMPKEDLNDFHFSQVIMRINNALQKNFHYRDICVLTATNKNGSLVANYLNEHNIPVVSNDSLLLSNCIEINVLTSFFKYLQNNKDLVSATVILNYLLNQKRISTERFHEQAVKLSSNSLYTLLNENGLSFDEHEIQTKNLLDIAIYFIEKLHLNKTETSNVYLRFFLDEVSKFMSTKNSNVNDFNTWWEKRSEKSSLVISENVNAVRVMTIHGSKGLEFPVVIIPFCNWSLQKTTEQWVQLHDEQLPIRSAYFPLNNTSNEAGFTEEVETENQEVTLEHINLLYVAFTRAVDQLHIVSSVSDKYKAQTVNTWITDFIANNSLFKTMENGFEMGEELPKSLGKGHELPDITTLQTSNLNTHSNAVKIKGSYFKGIDTTSDAKEKGILMHNLLSRIETKNDIAGAISLALSEGAISQEQVQSIEPLLNDLLNIETLQEYFSGKYLTRLESEILLDNGEIIRPDRICISDNETCIIDYKTGKENTAKYIKQMQAYENALTQMNYKNIKKLIVYIEELKVIQVS